MFPTEFAISMTAKKKPKRMGNYSPRKPAPPGVPDDIKAEVEAKANELVETYLKPRYIKPPLRDERWNYIINLFFRWHRRFSYFCSTYACPGPNAISPTFESKFARMEYVGDGRFSLAYRRHTEKWLELAQGLTAEDCLEMIRDAGTFQP
jgi:hypothetical protein